MEPADQEGVLRALAILGDVAQVMHPQAGVFDLSGYDNPVDAILAIITRHPMREDQIYRVLAAQTSIQVEDALAGLLADGRAQVVERYGVRFWSAAPAHYPSPEQSQRTRPGRGASPGSGEGGGASITGA